MSNAAEALLIDFSTTKGRAEAGQLPGFGSAFMNCMPAQVMSYDEGREDADADDASSYSIYYRRVLTGTFCPMASAQTSAEPVGPPTTRRRKI